MQIDTIDWHDFVVVDTIELYDDVDMEKVGDEKLEEEKA